MPRLRAPRRPYRRFDWNLRSCGLHGHVTYQPTEPDLAARLTADTPAGPAWRCLRCGTFVTGPPRSTGPADHAPIVLRGNALKDAAILRFLAVERALRGLLLIALAYGIYKFDGARDSLRRTLDTYLPLLKPVADRLNIDLAHTGPVRLIEKAVTYQHATLMWVAAGVLAYAALQLTEATGLWLLKRWGEYVAVIGTSVFLPLELYELAERVTVLRIGALTINILAVIYLVWTKRLFGLRGGHAAFEAERHSVSLLEVEKAALAPAPAPRHVKDGRASTTRF